MLSYPGALVPGQAAAELLGQGGDRRSDGVAHGLGAIAGESGPVLLGAVQSETDRNLLDGAG